MACCIYGILSVSASFVNIPVYTCSFAAKKGLHFLFVIKDFKGVIKWCFIIKNRLCNGMSKAGQ